MNGADTNVHPAGGRDWLTGLLEHLEARQARGQRLVYLPKPVREAFFAAPPMPPRPAPLPPARPRPAPARYESPATRAASPALAGKQEMRDSPPSTPVPISAAGETAGVNREPAPDLSILDLAQVAHAVSACRRCLLQQHRTQTVFADGSTHARLMFIGEAPGEDEDRQGVPFVGRAGQLLTKMIEAMGLRRDEVYIANVVKCRPPQNRTPFEEEAQACLPYLKRQVELVKPEVIVLLGATPLLHLLGKKGITAVHGNWFLYQDIPVLPTFHPSYLLRVPAKKREAWEDLQKVMARMGLKKGPVAS